MAKMYSSNQLEFKKAPPKRSRQGRSVNTKLSPTSRNGKKKLYRGQGRG